MSYRDNVFYFLVDFGYHQLGAVELLNSTWRQLLLAGRTTFTVLDPLVDWTGLA